MSVFELFICIFLLYLYFPSKKGKKKLKNLHRYKTFLRAEISIMPSSILSDESLEFYPFMLEVLLKIFIENNSTFLWKIFQNGQDIY